MSVKWNHLAKSSVLLLFSKELVKMAHGMFYLHLPTVSVPTAANYNLQGVCA